MKWVSAARIHTHTRTRTQKGERYRECESNDCSSILVPTTLGNALFTFTFFVAAAAALLFIRITFLTLWAPYRLQTKK